MSGPSSVPEAQPRPVENLPPVAEDKGILRSLASLPYQVRRRLEWVQRLEQYRTSDPEQYVQEQQRAMQELNLSQRSLQRLQREYRNHGLDGILRRTRSDCGQAKVAESWQADILKLYRQGNRGMRQTSPSQIATLVESRAAEQGVKEAVLQKL
jgi:putative transposase